ncbi:MAG TPA: peptidoglycan DD-metalloendopeptidase family protein [Candidatus Paceibacterota bacterium]
MPISVYAGAIGFFSTIFKNSGEDVLSWKNNLQNMALLTAIESPIGREALAYSAPVVENNALVPSDGPLGNGIEALIHKPTSDQISVYVVHKGDTLSQIAEMFNVTVNTIKWGNDLDSNVLREGQVLVILPISGVRHTVSKGDTVVSIAKKYKGDMEEILAYNSLKQEDSLVVGSVVIIPDGEILTSSVSTKSSTFSGGVSSTKEYVGYYARPISGGRRTQGVHGYNAVDIAAPVGTPVMASADGEVIISRSGGWNGGYGNYVVIKHSNGTQTLYAHNSQNKVVAGDSVKQGDVIGLVGATGKATGSHLHFEIRGAKNPF